jgi:CRISPR-associated endonuclease/helicase Cas3
VKAAIAAHHGKLSYRHEERWHDRDDFRPIWNEFAKVSSSMFKPTDRKAFEKAILLRYQYAGPRALLQLADHRASALEDGSVPKEFKKYSYSFPHVAEDGTRSLRGVQKIVSDFWDELFAILRAPTGSGKTDAALIWATHQIERGKAERLIFAMPTRFTAGALSVNIAETLSLTGLYHSSTSLTQERSDVDMARLLDTPITVTTIDHLCICLTATREDQHAIFFNLANACVVIDEADFYDDFTQRNIVVLLETLRILDVPVLLMSATVPESATVLYKSAGFNSVKIYSDTSEEGIREANRPRCNLVRSGQYEAPDDLKDILDRALKGEAMIIYANTVARAQNYLQWFKDQNCKYPIVMYHSRFTEPDKAKKETDLLDMLGVSAWKNARLNNRQPNGIAILTQIGELSVNISTKLMISDLCPADRLTQRIGRLCRFDDSVGDLFVVEPVRKKKGVTEMAPAPYGQWLGSRWVPVKALLETKRLLVDKCYSAQDLVELVDIIYPDVPDKSTRTATNEQALRDAVVHNWLIVPASQTDQDDDDTDRWSSRDIPAQKTVFVNGFGDFFSDDDSNVFNSRRDFRRFEMENRVQCHSYEFETALKNELIQKTDFFISTNNRDELRPEHCYVAKKGCYTFEAGLNLRSDDI